MLDIIWECLVAQYLQLSTFLSTLCALWICFFVCHLTMSNSLASCILLRTDSCTLCASALRTHSKTCSHVASLMSSIMLSSFRILSYIRSSFSPLMNCTVSNLSYSLYWWSAAFVLSLLIHSFHAFIIFVSFLWYCSNMTILLFYGLNLLHDTLKRSPIVLAVLFFFLCKSLYHLYNLPAQPIFYH